VSEFCLWSDSQEPSPPFLGQNVDVRQGEVA
jgi:hypothetical protein